MRETVARDGSDLKPTLDLLNELLPGDTPWSGEHFVTVLGAHVVVSKLLKKLEVAERMAQALGDLLSHLGVGAYAGEDFPEGHPMLTARDVHAEWEALK